MSRSALAWNEEIDREVVPPLNIGVGSALPASFLFGTSKIDPVAGWTARLNLDSVSTLPPAAHHLEARDSDELKPYGPGNATSVQTIAESISPGFQEGIAHYFPVQMATWPITNQIAIVRTKDRTTEMRFRNIFQKAIEEFFEDGMDNEFTAELGSLVQKYGPDSKYILARILKDNTSSPSVWAEAMRWIGRADEVMSSGSRLFLLKEGLKSQFAEVRDGAALGLASMDDPFAVPYLERAIASERVEELRKDMKQVLDQLRSR
jgi:hypothetical protein